MGNVECFLSCFFTSSYRFNILILAIVALFTAVGYLMSKESLAKIRYYWLLNILILSNAPLLYLTMLCDMLWFLRIYILYVAVAMLVLITIPAVYRLYLSRKYELTRFWEMESLLRKLSGSAKARLYIFGSALPKAFTLGKDVFLSAGIVDLLDPEELKAVIAHEAFHVKQNRYPLIRNFKILTFLPSTKLEEYADLYAEKIAGKWLESAKEKIRNFYLDYSS